MATTFRSTSYSILRGRVVDDRGAPVPGALVGASSSGDRSVTRTSRLGRFTLGIVSAGPVRLLARKPGFLIAIRTRVAAWSDEVRLVLARGASLSGRIVARPLPERWWLRLRRIEEGRRLPAPLASALIRAAGVFSATGLPAGTYELAAEGDGLSCPEPLIVTVAAGETRDGLEIPLRAG